MICRSVYIRCLRISTMATQMNVEKALDSVQDRVKKACDERTGDLPQITPRVVAVSKTKPAELIQQAYQCGQRHFGENYVQELAEKSSNTELMSSCDGIRWHFIGHLQTNKVKKVLGSANLHMIETIHSKKLANEVNKHWEKIGNGQRLKVMVQINTSGEENKHGIKPSECASLVDHVRSQCSNLELAGIMTIGAFDHDLTKGPNPDFQVLIKCRDEVCDKFSLPKESVELSMGMSGDFEHAISVGSTNVRIGSTIFGARDYSAKTNDDKTQSSSKSDNVSSVSEDVSKLKIDTK